jgi:transposase
MEASKGNEVALCGSDIDVLRSWSRGSGADQSVTRAAIVLMAAQGLPHTEIARTLGVSRSTVVSWIRRYREEEIDGLLDRPRQGRPRVVDEMELLLRTLLCRPSDHPVHRWSSRSLATRMGISNTTVARVWRRWGLRPDHPDEFSLPLLPELPGQVTEVVGMLHHKQDKLLVVRVGRDVATPRRRPTVAPGGMVAAGSVGSESKSAAVFLDRVLKRHDQPLRLISASSNTYADPAVATILAQQPGLRCHVVTDGLDWLTTATLALGLTRLSGPMSVPGRNCESLIRAVREFVDAVRRCGDVILSTSAGKTDTSDRPTSSVRNNADQARQCGRVQHGHL